MSGVLKKLLCVTPLLVGSSLIALPQKGEVATGSAEFHKEGDQCLKITASDKAIIHYQQFNVQEKEVVQFVQPSSKATVLNRVTGEDPSEIFGELKGNGRVFLVNPKGIYFGPSASVNVGSFVASTLNLRDEDFSKDKFEFFQEAGSEKGAIINEGTISVEEKGFVGLFAPFIKNRGSIIARAGKVVLASAEKVTLDFKGDGLIQFSLEGDLEDALIENYGLIEAAHGAIELSTKLAKEAIKRVVNTDGLTVAAAIEEVDGVIRLVSPSEIVASKVHIKGVEGGAVVAGGEIRATTPEGKGGEVHLLGTEVIVTNGQIDASGVTGGGEVLIGGDYQGKGEIPNANFVVMGQDAQIYADALSEGEGGKVILWADETTLFDGKIYARGGPNGGNGGFVETSGKEDLGIQWGFVDTSAPKGNYGDWLLDPNSIVIATGGGASIAQCSAPNCANNPSRTIDPATIAAAVTNVSLCATRNANSSITVTNAVSMTNSGINLTLTAGSASAGPINLNNSITTRGGTINLVGTVVLGAPVTLNTTNATPTGADISFSNTINGAQVLTFNAGTAGNVKFTGAVGGTTPLTNLTFTAASSINLGANIAVSGANPLSFPIPVTLQTNSTITSNNANITFGSTVNGDFGLTLVGGTGTVTLTGAVGGTTPLANLVFTSAGLIQIGGNITRTRPTALTFPSPVSLLGPSIITSNNSNIAFNSTLNGAQTLSVNTSTGTITFTGAIGGTTPLSTLSASGTTVTQSSTARTTGSLTYAGPTAINVNGNITTNGGIITMTGPVTRTATLFDTTNGGANTIGANVSFSSTLNGGGAFTVAGGTGGMISFGGAIGGVTSLTSLTVSGFTITQSSTARTTGALNYTGSSAINVGGNITTSGNTIGMVGPVVVSNTPTFDTTNAGGSPTGATISFSNTLNGATALTLRAGTGGNISFAGAVGGVTPLTNLTFTSANQIQVGNNIRVSGANPLVFPSPVSLTGTSNITSNNANITFNSTINGAQMLTLTGGSGSLTLTGAVGGVTPLTSLTFASANNVTANALTVGALAQTAGSGTTTFNGVINTSNLLGIDLTGTGFTFNNTVTTTSNGGVQIANSGILSMPTAATFSVSGPFSQTGTGSVQAGNMVTANGISFASGVLLTNNTSFTTPSALITFNSTINSISTTPFNLTLNAGTSNITILSNVGSINSLGTFLVSSTNNLTMQGLIANTATLTSGTGTTTVNGNLTVGSGGITLTGNNFVNNGDVVTTNGGSVVINNSGTATRAPGHTTVVDGNYTVNGPGPTFAGSSLTVKGFVLIVPPVTLASNAVVDTSGGNGNITFSSTINGNQNLTLTAGSGSIVLNGNVGSLVGLNALTFGSALNVTTQAITASSIAQTTGTGTTTFNGALNTSGALGISINTNNIIRGAAITTTGGGPVTITNSGTFTSTAVGDITCGGAFTQNGTGPVSLGGSITTANANLSFSSPITLAATTAFNTGTGAGNITLSQAVQGAFSLDLNSGAGNITLSGGVGTITPLTAFTITRAANASTQAISAATITQTVGTGTTTFNGALTTTGAGGISLTGTGFTFNNTFTIGGTGSLAINNSGQVTFSSAATGSIAGGFTQTGTGGTTLGSTITAGGVISFQGAFTAGASGGTLTTQAVNQPITFSSTVDGPGNLTLSSGTAAISLMGAAGGLVPLGNFTVSTVGTLTTEAITAASITQSTGAGVFNGDLATTGSGGVSLTGSTFNLLGNVTAAGSGPIAIVNSGTLTTAPGTTLTGNGGFTQSGGGSVSLGSGVTTNNANIFFTNPITLTGNVLLNSGTSLGDITVPTINGNYNLTFRAGRDIIAGVIGGTPPFGNVTIISARDVNASSITASAIFQLAGTGTTAVTGNLTTDSPSGINLVLTNFTRVGNIVTTNGGSFSITNSGTITGSVANSTTVDGAYTQTGVGPSDSYSLAGDITARTGISLSSPITLFSDVTLDTSSGNGSITITNSLNNQTMPTHNLTLITGAGDVTLSGDIGISTPIGQFILGDMHDITCAGISATSVHQVVSTTITGQATFNGSITTSGVAGIVLSGNAFTFNDMVTTTGTGPVTLTNTGLLSISSGSVFTVDGAFTQIGSGTVSLGREIDTNNAAISFAGAIDLPNPAILNSGGGAGNILLSSTLDGPSTLELTAGTGNITFTGAIGHITPVGGITIQSGNAITVSSNAALSGPFNIVSATGTTTLNGTLDASSISLSGAAINFNQGVTTSSGPIAITNSGTFTVASLAPITAATNFTQTGAGTVTLGSNVSTTGTLSFASAITLTQPISLNSGGGDLTLSSNVTGAFDFSLTAGAGNISILGAIGNPTRVGVFTITSVNDLTVQSITASSMTMQSGTGTSTLLGSLDTNAVGGISLTGTNFTSSGTITTTNGGPLTVTNSGLVTATGVSTITLNGGGALTQNGTGPVNLGGTITTQNANISHSSPVTVLATTTFTSGGGNIVFQNTIDGPDCLELQAGTGNVTLSGVVGGTTPLGCLTAVGGTIFQNQSVTAEGPVVETGSVEVQLSGNITTTLATNPITLTGPVTLNNNITLSTVAGGSDITVNGNVNGDGAGRNFTVNSGAGMITLSSAIGGNTSFNNITLTGNQINLADIGSTSIGATGTTMISATSDLNFTGTVYRAATQSYTAGSDFNFNAGVATSMFSNANPLTFNTGTIQLNTTDVTMTSSGGNITIGQLRGAGQNYTVNAGAGDFTFVQIGASGFDLNTVDLTATNFSPTPVNGVNVFATTLIFTSPVTLILTGAQTITNTTYNVPILIDGAVDFNVCGSTPATITFNDSVDANAVSGDSLSFDFSGCAGSVVFNAPVGGTTPLDSLTIDTATSTTVSSIINVGFLDVTGTTTTFASGLTTTNGSGVTIDSATINLGGSFITTNGGPFSLTNSGALTISTGSSFTISGSFTQAGAGTVSFGGSFATAAQDISFAGATTLTGGSTLNSSGGNITFSSTINGAQSFALTAGSGSITLTGAVGGGTPLTTFLINSANNVTTSSIAASTITQLAGTGTSSFGALSTTGLNGIQLTGTAFTLNGAITTTNSGPLTINNSGLLNFPNAVTHTIAGALTQLGSGSVTLGGTFNIGGAGSFAQAITLSNNATLNTSSNNQPLTFSSTIDNDMVTPHTLTLNTGTGTLTCSGAIGGTTPIGALTITNVGTGNFNAIAAASLTQTAGTGTTTFNGDITTTGAISLTGAGFTLNSTVQTTGGSVSISNSSLLSLTLGSMTLIDGTFAQTGGGEVSLSGTLATTNQALSFANAITLAGATTLSSGPGAGNITLSSTVNGNQALTLTAGTGTISFGGALGSVTPLGALTVTSVNGITYPMVTASSIVQQANTGTTTITGPFSTTGALGVSINGGMINQNGTITTTNGGPVTFTNSSTLTVAADTVASGGYTQTGAGTVSLGRNVTTVNNPISFASAISLTNGVSLTAGPNSSNANSITLSNTVSGTQDFTLSAAGGSIALNGPVDLANTGAFTIVNADTVTATGIAAASISQQVGTGTTTFNGALDARTTTGISLIGNAFTFNDTIDSSGALLLTNSGLATFNVGATGAIDSGITQNGIGGVLLASDLTTANNNIEIQGALTTTGTTAQLITLDQNITLFNTFDGPGDLTLSSAGSIELQSDGGAITRLGDVVTEAISMITYQGVRATSLTQNMGSTNTFNGVLDMSGGGINVTGSEFIFLEDVTVTGGNIILVNSSNLTTTVGKTFTATGSFTQSGGGNIFLASTINADGGVSFTGTPISLIGPVILNSSGGGGNIFLSVSTAVSGAQPFTVNSGAGNITLSGALGGGGMPLTAFTITSAADVSLPAVTASSIRQLAGTGTTTQNGALTTSGPLGISFVGNNFNSNGSFIVTTNGGSLTFTNQGVVDLSFPLTITIDGAFIQNGPGSIFIKSMTARQGFSFTGPTFVSNVATTLNSSSGPGDITFASTVSGVGGTEVFTLNAGLADITLSQPLGATIPVDTFTATGETISVNNIGNSISAGVTGTTTLTASQEVIFTGSQVNANTQNYTTASPFQINSGTLTTFNSNGNTMTFAGGGVLLSTGTDLTMNTGGSTLTLQDIHAQSGNLRNLVLNTGAGNLTLGQLGSLANGEFGSASFTCANLNLSDAYANQFTFNYTGTLTTTGDIISTDTSLTFPAPVVLQSGALFSTVSTTGANITFNNTLDGFIADAFALTLNAGGGDITFGNVGTTNRLLNLSLNTVRNATFASTMVDGLVQFSGSGTTTFGGPLVVPGAIGIQLTGNNFAFSSTVTTLNNASLSVANSGTLTFAGLATLSGAFTQSTASGPVTLSGSITAGQPIQFAGAVTLSGTPSLSTAAANQTINFQNTVNGSGDLTLATGTDGDLFFSSPVGAVTPIGTLTVTSSHNITTQSLFAETIQTTSSSDGTATFNGTLSSQSGGTTLTGNTFNFNGPFQTTASFTLTNSGLATFASNTNTVSNSFTQNGPGPVNFAGSLTTQIGPIFFGAAFSATGASSFNTSSGSQNLTFLSTVNGPSSLTANAGGGDITFSQLVGGVAPLYRVNHHCSKQSSPC